MPDDSRLLELILRFDELRDAGEQVSPEVLCRDCPDLLPALRARLNALQAMDALLSSEDPGSGSPEPTRSRFPEIPNYQILRELGRGGMGVVYEARHAASGRTVALKMHQSDRSVPSSQRARFRNEIEAIARLQHPNVVRIFEIGTHGGLPFYTMERLDGGTLEDKIAGGAQPARESAELVEVLAQAIHAAHEHGIVHRDLSPGNVLLTADGVPKITDFGLAKRLTGGARLTRTLQVLGTPSYMAPEQATGRSKQAGPATDIYSLGAILYRLLTGRPPFVGRTIMEIVMQAAEAHPDPPRRIVSSVPVDLETICLRCLQKRPRHRYPNAAALADDLRHFLNGEPVPHSRSLRERVAEWFRSDHGDD